MPVEPYKRLSTIYKSAQVQNHSAEMFLAMAILSPTNQEHGKNNLNLKVKLEKYFRNKVKSPSFRKAINGLRLRSKIYLLFIFAVGIVRIVDVAQQGRQLVHLLDLKND